MPRNVLRGRRTGTKEIHGLLDLGEATAFDRFSQQDLVGKIVPGGVDVEQSVTHQQLLQFGLQLGIFRLEIDPGARQDVGQRLEVVLAVA